MNFFTHFKCNVCDEKYSIELKSVKKNKMCVFCSGEKIEDSEDSFDSLKDKLVFLTKHGEKF